MTTNDNLIQVHQLCMYFPVLAGLFRRKVGDVKAVDNISFSIKRGETLGVVGESGCGKTTTGRTLLQLYKPTSGNVIFDGIDLTRVGPSALRRTRRHMQLIYQDPYASLDPRQTAGEIVIEALKIHGLLKKDECQDKINELLTMVELEPRMSSRYPHEFSGGQRQRLGIARALALRPKFIVCDESVSALDVSIQVQIIKLLIKLKDELNLTYLFIAHDVAVVRHISDKVAIMYLGKIVEITQSDELYDRPLHPYTQALLSAVPIPDPKLDRLRKRVTLKGDVPSPVNPPKGCHFHPRCLLANDTCRNQAPELVNVGSEHWVACHRI